MTDEAEPEEAELEEVGLRRLGLQLHPGATSAGNVEESGEFAFFRRNVHIGHFGGKCRNLSSRSEEAGVRRLGLQPHTGVTSAGNVKESGEFAFFRRNFHVGHFGGKCRFFFKARGGWRVAARATATHWGYVSGQCRLLVGVTAWDQVREQGM